MPTLRSRNSLASLNFPVVKENTRSKSYKGEAEIDLTKLKRGVASAKLTRSASLKLSQSEVSRATHSESVKIKRRESARIVRSESVKTRSSRSSVAVETSESVEKVSTPRQKRKGCNVRENVDDNANLLSLASLDDKINEVTICGMAGKCSPVSQQHKSSESGQTENDGNPLVMVSINNLNRTPEKRKPSNDNVSATECSPNKKSKDIGQATSGEKPKTPVSGRKIKRMLNTDLSDLYNSPVKENIPTPVKSPLSVHKSARALSFSPSHSQPSVVRKILTPTKDSSCNKMSPHRMLTFFPSNRESIRLLAGCPSKSSPIKPAGARCLAFSPTRSPAKSIIPSAPLSPVKTPNSFTSPSKLLLSPHKNFLHEVRRSPRKLNCKSPLKLTSPCKTPLSPRKEIFTEVRRSPRKLDMKSPLRLAKQEGICYQRAKQVLHTALPERVVCREKEVAQISRFLKDHVGKQVAGSLYISGAPGTGKTAVVSNMMKELKMRKDCQVAYVNCMGLRSSQAIYNKVLSEFLKKETCLNVKQATKDLEKFLTAKSQPVVLVLDEMDQLDSKNQEVLYTMFEWPAMQKSRLVLVGIANALDLTDRILPRLQARPKCRPELLHFPPYTKDQIVAVLKHRLEKVELDGLAILDPSAIQFVARKVSAVAGDMRKALDVCRRAVEVVEADVRKQSVLKPVTVYNSPSKRSAPKKITIAHISKVINEVYGSGVVTGSGQRPTIPLQHKLAICTLLLMMKRSKIREAPIGKFHEAYSKICRRQEVAGIDQTEFMGLCTLVEARGIFGIKKAKDTRNTKVTLKLDEKEVEHALQDKLLMTSILQHGLS